MSIATEVSRIQSDRNTIRNKLVELGLATSTDNLDTLAQTISDLSNQGAVAVEVKEGESYTIPAGYHNGGGTVVGVAGGGNYSLQAKSVTPTKAQQSVAPDSGYYGLSGVTVAAIPDAYQDVSGVTAAAADVLSGKVYVLADGTVTTGTMTNNGAVAKTLNTTTISYTIPKGYHNGSGKVSIELEETKFVTPNKSVQYVYPSTGKVLSGVEVDPIPDKYADVSNVTLKPEHAVSGAVFVDANGVEQEGEMAQYSEQYTIDGMSVTSYTIPNGQHIGTTVSLTDDIETALAAI